MDKLALSEVYSTLIDSGKLSGKRVICVRLFGTNYKDRLELRKYASTIDKDKKNKKMVSFQELSDLIDEQKHGIRDILITGGEPLVQQNALIEFLKYVKKKKRMLNFILETNGMTGVLPELDNHISDYIVNVKLSNSTSGTPKETFTHRVKKDELEKLIETKKAHFVFDITNNQSILEVQEIQGWLKISPDDVWLRGGEVTAQGAILHLKLIWQACLSYGYRFSNRVYTQVYGGNIQRGI